jgi:WD40 repeat protein
VNQPDQLSPSVNPLVTFDAHSLVVEDVAWSYHDPNTFASVSDDKRMKFWDQRQPGVA